MSVLIDRMNIIQTLTGVLMSFSMVIKIYVDTPFML